MFRGISQTPTSPSTIRSAEGPGDGLRLAPGDTFRATVIYAKRGGEVLLLARGTRFQAFATRPLQEGRNYLLQVRSMGERILLKVVEGEAAERTSAVRLWATGRADRAELGNFLRSLAGAVEDERLSEPIRNALSALKSRLPGLVFRAPAKDGFQWMMRQLRDSGLFLESRAARHLLEGSEAPFQSLTSSDLKGLLLSLKALLSGGEVDSPRTADLAQQVDQALHVVETDQLLNLSSLKDGLGWFWFIPGLWKEGFRGGEAFLQKPGTDDEALHLSLSLDFTRLGHMEVSVSLNRSVVGLRILTEDQTRAEFVSRHLEELRSGLSEAGLQAGTVVCRKKQEDDPEWAPFLEFEKTANAVDIVM